ncbi:phage tail protein [Sporosarcina sp. FSL K6-5500]|uniref:phage tail protein n=1 Tax=Sporosarcina sp. FSL K6-5500 TaxID=2921558 RepID=UPI0030FCD438
MSVIINIDDAAFRDIQRRLAEIPNKAPNAISAALNRTVTNVATNLNKEVRKEYTIKAGDVKGTIKKRTANRGDLRASVKSTGGVIPLDKFKTSKLGRKQVKVAVKKGQLKKVLGAFAADISGPKIFKRKTKKRLPINKLFGPSVPQMAGESSIAERINNQASETFERRLDHEINRLLARLGG